MGVSLPRLSVVHLRHRRSVLAVLAGVAILLELAAGTGLAYVAGWSRVRAVPGDFDGRWLIALAGALLVSFVGYHYAYRGIFRVEGGPVLPRRQMRAVVAAGFGGFLAHGGGALDQYALSGRGQPPADFTIPWAVIPIPGFLAGFWAAGRYGGRFRDRADWRGKLGIFLDSIRIIRVLFTHPLRWGSALCGMALFWAADAFATWAGLAMFGVRMNAAGLFVGFATGMLFTRRTGPAGRRGRAGPRAAPDHLGQRRAARGRGGRRIRLPGAGLADARLARRPAHTADDGPTPGIAAERGRRSKRARPAAHARYPGDEGLRLTARYGRSSPTSPPRSSLHARSANSARLDW